MLRKLTYQPYFKVRWAGDGWYVVDCRDQIPGKVVAWFATSDEAVRDARERSVAVAARRG
jgi:hypothetical protein